MPVGVGADKLGCDFGAINRANKWANAVAKAGNVKTCKVKQLCHLRIGKKRSQIWAWHLRFGDFDKVRIAITA